MVRIALVLGVTALQGCSKDDAPKAPAREPQATPTRADVALAPDGADEVPALVQEQLKRAKREGRELLVYVGATWCEPCTRFHKAVEAGELDATFPALRLYEFDLDRDRDRLDRAGYGSRMIPLFVVPADDGQGSPLRIEGSIKGEGAVKDITPRLQALLAQARAAR
jgi:hypothetical protein